MEYKLPEFKEFPKIARLNRDCIITEKIDGTNGLIYIDEENNLFVGSRTRWLDDHNDNFGFYHWVMANKEELLKLGKGYHYGEFMGKGIQRNYGLNEKRFYLFNVKWNDKLIRPKCCYVVPILYQGLFDSTVANYQLKQLEENGSYAIPGYMNPEGIVIYHKAGNVGFKVTIKNDEKPKSELK